MTLDEAIRHAEEVAESKEKQVKNGDWEKDSLTERNCIKSAEEHRQLAEWLKDYKRLKEQSNVPDINDGDMISRQAVLDKIRAEIVNDWQLKKYPSSPFSCGLRRAIEIIDKYKAERSDKE